jgi:hypothetical protein
MDLTSVAIRPQLAQCSLENSSNLGFPVGTFAACATLMEDFGAGQLVLLQLSGASEFSPVLARDEFNCPAPSRKSTNTTSPTAANDGVLAKER